MDITSFYESTVRKRRWGTQCKRCRKELEIGSKCMRAQLGVNRFGCMTYDEICLECFPKQLPKEIKQAEKELETYIKEKKRIIEELKSSI